MRPIGCVFGFHKYHPTKGFAPYVVVPARTKKGGLISVKLRLYVCDNCGKQKVTIEPMHAPRQD